MTTSPTKALKQYNNPDNYQRFRANATKNSFLYAQIESTLKNQTIRGHGGHGVVFEIENNRVVKQNYPQDKSYNTHFYNLMREAFNVTILNQLKVPYVSQLEMICSSGEMGFACFRDGGKDLCSTFYEAKGRCPLLTVEVIAYQSLTCLTALEKINMNHADLKSANICFDKGITTIIDWSSMLECSPEINLNQFTTVYMRAPEVHLQLPDCSTKADVWALGAVFFEIITGKTLCFAHSLPLSSVEMNTPSFMLQELEDRLGPLPNELIDASPIKKYLYEADYTLKNKRVLGKLRKCKVYFKQHKKNALDAFNASAAFKELSQREKNDIIYRHDRIRNLVLSMLTLDHKKRPLASELLNTFFPPRRPHERIGGNVR